MILQVGEREEVIFKFLNMSHSLKAKVEKNNSFVVTNRAERNNWFAICVVRTITHWHFSCTPQSSLSSLLFFIFFHLRHTHIPYMDEKCVM